MDGRRADDFVSRILSLSLAPELPLRLTNQVEWHEFTPLGFSLIQSLRPRRILEVGTTVGDSYASFCQAVQLCGLEAECTSIPRSKSASNAKSDLGQEEEFRAYHDARYARFSKIENATMSRPRIHDDYYSTFGFIHIISPESASDLDELCRTWLPTMSACGVALVSGQGQHDRSPLRSSIAKASGRFAVRILQLGHWIAIFSIRPIGIASDLLLASSADFNRIAKLLGWLGDRVVSRRCQIAQEVHSSQLQQKLALLQQSEHLLRSEQEVHSSQLQQKLALLQQSEHLLRSEMAVLQHSEGLLRSEVQKLTSLSARTEESEINAQIRFGQTALRLDQMWAEKEELRLRLQNDEDANRTSAGEVSSDERNLNPHCDRPFDGAAKILFQLRRLYSLERDPIVLRGRDTWDNIGRSVLASILAMRRRLLYPKSSMPTVSVIVVLRNKIHLSILCLCSLLLETDVDYELIIVDNGSSDETTAVLSLIDSATIIRNVDNLGFGPAVMQGASRASGEFLCLLNNDALLQRGSLAACLRVFSGRSDTGAVGGKVLLADGLLQEAGCIVWRDGRTLQYGRGQDPWLPQFNFRRPVDYCSGVFLITPRLLFQTLGGLDDRYSPAYFEDTDYCMKLWAAGRPVIYEPKSVVHHYEGASSSKFATTRAAIAANHLRFTDRWRSVLRSYQVEGSQNVLRARIAAQGGSGRCLYYFGSLPDAIRGLWCDKRTRDVRSLVGNGAKVTVLFRGECVDVDLQLLFGSDVELRNLESMTTEEIGDYCAASDVIIAPPDDDSNHDITELLSSHKARGAPI